VLIFLSKALAGPYLLGQCIWQGTVLAFRLKTFPRDTKNPVFRLSSNPLEVQVRYRALWHEWGIQQMQERGIKTEKAEKKNNTKAFEFNYCGIFGTGLYGNRSQYRKASVKSRLLPVTVSTSTRNGFEICAESVRMCFAAKSAMNNIEDIFVTHDTCRWNVCTGNVKTRRTTVSEPYTKNEEWWLCQHYTTARTEADRLITKPCTLPRCNSTPIVTCKLLIVKWLWNR